ncbi:MAG: dephospho-CoA kinase [Gammaproteobacteria bacterium]|nr:dephospho-CoA kinase [Gammaproteobacteria bacterium]
MRVGLTGGIACGKSTVANMFSELGVAVIDTDVIARDVVQPGEPALQKLVEAFGAEILNDQNRLDRRRMRERVFADENERRKLESILHPVIAQEMLDRAERAGGIYQILVIPLLLETGMGDLVDRVLVVDCLPQTQSERLIRRDGETKASARRMLDAQIGRARRLARADDVLVNNGNLDQLRDSVRDLHETYTSLPA